MKLEDEGLILDRVSESADEPLETLFSQTNDEALTCPFCGESECSLSCDESQAGGFNTQNPNFKYFDCPYFFSSKDSGSILVRVPVKILSDKTLGYDEDDRVIEFAIMDKQMDESFSRNIQEPVEIDEAEYNDRCGREKTTEDTPISDLKMSQKVKDIFAKNGIKIVKDLTKKTRGEWIRQNGIKNSTLQEFVDPLFFKTGLDYFQPEGFDGFRYFKIIMKDNKEKFIKLGQSYKWNDIILFKKDAVIEEAIQTKQLNKNELTDLSKVVSILKSEYERNKK